MLLRSFVPSRCHVNGSVYAVSDTTPITLHSFLARGSKAGYSLILICMPCDLVDITSLSNILEDDGFQSVQVLGSLQTMLIEIHTVTLLVLIYVKTYFCKQLYLKGYEK